MAWSDEALTYLRKHREYVGRDLELLRAGKLKITADSGDVTADWIGRHERQLAHLDSIIERSR